MGYRLDFETSRTESPVPPRGHCSETDCRFLLHGQPFIEVWEITPPVDMIIDGDFPAKSVIYNKMGEEVPSPDGILYRRAVDCRKCERRWVRYDWTDQTYSFAERKPDGSTKSEQYVRDPRIVRRRPVK